MRKFTEKFFFFSGFISIVAVFEALPTYHTMETCVTFTWMQLCDKLLEVTGKYFLLPVAL
mgnify:CR=1 FL=1